MLDKAVQDYITTIRVVGGVVNIAVVNIAVVMTAAEEIIAAQDWALFVQHGSNASFTDQFLAPQIIYKGKTERSHPKVSVPTGWGVWHSDNHQKAGILDAVTGVTPRTRLSTFSLMHHQTVFCTIFILTPMSPLKHCA